MKRLTLILIIIIAAGTAFAQNDLFEQLTDEYADNNGFSASLITSDMFDLYLKKKNIDKDSPVFEALKNLENILVVSQSNFSKATWVEAGEEGTDEKNNAGEIHESILDYYKKKDFSLFKTEKQMGEDVKVYLDKKGSKISSLALITNSPSLTTLVELQGNIDLSTVSELNKALNLRGLENLYKINGSGRGIAVSGYGVSQERIEEMTQRQKEMIERQRVLTEEQRQQIEFRAKEMTERQKEMAEKYREMAEKYKRQPVFLNYPGDGNTIYMIDGKKVDADAVKKLNPDQIQTIEVKGGEEENDPTTIKIITKK